MFAPFRWRRDAFIGFIIGTKIINKKEKQYELITFNHVFCLFSPYCFPSFLFLCAYFSLPRASLMRRMASMMFSSLVA